MIEQTCREIIDSQVVNVGRLSVHGMYCDRLVNSWGVG